MKFLMSYNEHSNPDFNKTVRMTLPNEWEKARTSDLLKQFIKPYNKATKNKNKLSPRKVHLAIRNDEGVYKPIPTDTSIGSCIQNRSRIHIRHGPSKTMKQLKEQFWSEFEQKKRREEEIEVERQKALKITVQHEDKKVTVESTSEERSEDDNSGSEAHDQRESVETSRESNENEPQVDPNESEVEPPRNVEDTKNESEVESSQESNEKNKEAILERFRVILEDFGVDVKVYDKVIDEMKGDFALLEMDDDKLEEAIKNKLGSMLQASFQAVSKPSNEIKEASSDDMSDFHKEYMDSLKAGKQDGGTEIKRDNISKDGDDESIHLMQTTDSLLDVVVTAEAEKEQLSFLQKVFCCSPTGGCCA